MGKTIQELSSLSQLGDSDLLLVDTAENGSKKLTLSNLKNNLKMASAVSADKATTDASDQNIASTYIKGLSISGTTVTLTKGNGTESTITTQDTTYSTGDGSNAGITKLYTTTGNNTDGTMTQAAITTALGQINSFEISVVSTLPTGGANDPIDNHTIYLTPSANSGTDNAKDEWIHTASGWEKIGVTRTDLSNYYTKTETMSSTEITSAIGAVDVGVTSITAGDGLSGGTITGTGTISLPTQGGVTAGSYGPAADVTGSDGNTISVPSITVDAYGRITAVSNKTYTSVDNNTTYSQGTGISISSNTISLASGVITAGSAGPSTDVTGSDGATIAIPTITVDGYGRVTALGSQTYTSVDTTYTPQALGFGYGTCDTAAATTAKTVTLSGYELVAHGIVAVNFTYAVPASATLSINSKTAKAIYYKGAAIADGIIGAGDTATFIYDGTHYVLLSIDSSITAFDSGAEDANS